MSSLEDAGVERTGTAIPVMSLRQKGYLGGEIRSLPEASLSTPVMAAMSRK